MLSNIAKAGMPSKFHCAATDQEVMKGFHYTSRRDAKELGGAVMHA